MKASSVYILLSLCLVGLLLSAGCGQRAPGSGLENVFGKNATPTATPTPVPTTEPYPDVTVRISGPGTGLVPTETTAPAETPVPLLKDVYHGIFNFSYMTYTRVSLDYNLERPPLVITAIFTPKEIKRVIVTTSEYGQKEEVRITTGHVTANTKAIITVKNASTGSVIVQDGYRGTYSAESVKVLRVARAGNITVEVEGLDVEVDLRMQVYE